MHDDRRLQHFRRIAVRTHERKFFSRSIADTTLEEYTDPLNDLPDGEGVLSPTLADYSEEKWHYRSALISHEPLRLEMARVTKALDHGVANVPALFEYLNRYVFPFLKLHNMVEDEFIFKGMANEGLCVPEEGVTKEHELLMRQIGYVEALESRFQDGHTHLLDGYHDALGHELIDKFSWLEETFIDHVDNEEEWLVNDTSTLSPEWEQEIQMKIENATLSDPKYAFFRAAQGDIMAMMYVSLGKWAGAAGQEAFIENLDPQMQRGMHERWLPGYKNQIELLAAVVGQETIE